MWVEYGCCAMSLISLYACLNLAIYINKNSVWVLIQVEYKKCVTTGRDWYVDQFLDGIKPTTISKILCV